jgi:hypothetical protein
MAKRTISRIDMFATMTYLARIAGEEKALSMDAKDITALIKKELKVVMSETTCRRILNDMGIAWKGYVKNIATLDLEKRMLKIEAFLTSYYGGEWSNFIPSE